MSNLAWKAVCSIFGFDRSMPRHAHQLDDELWHAMRLPAGGQLISVRKEPALRLAALAKANAKSTGDVPWLMNTMINRIEHETPCEWTQIYWEERYWITRWVPIDGIQKALFDLQPDEYKRFESAK